MAYGRERSSRKSDEMDEKFLVRRIQEYVRHGINSEEGELSDVRQTLFNAYMGAEYGNERTDRSRVVTREVLQAIEWCLPALMRIFLGSSKIVEFKASGPQDVQQAKQETDAVNHWFFDGNPEASGFILLYNFLKDLLLNQNAYFDVRVVEEYEEELKVIRDLLPGQVDELETKIEDDENASLEVLDERKDERHNITTYDVKITVGKMSKRISVSVIPPECCIIDRDHHELGLDRCRFVAVRTRKTLSELREEGYELDWDEIKPADDDVWNDEETTRYFYSDEEPRDTAGDDGAMDSDADRMLWVHECSMLVDFDGDGIAERRRVCMAGCHILDNEEDPYMPVVASSAIPMPHKHIGISYAEIVEDIQRVMTQLTRQLLDNITAQNVQRHFISEQALSSDNATLDQYLDRDSEAILVRGDPHAAVMPETITPIVDQIVKAIEVYGQTPQLRTGVSPQISMDPDILSKSTMGAFVGALDHASQRSELLARVVAETALVPVFLKMHHLGRTHFDKPQQLEINGQWTTVDPRTWPKRSAMKVWVGTGYNNKQVMTTLLFSLLQVQKEAMAAGLADHKGIFNTLEKLTEEANLGHVGTYFVDPKTPGWQPPPPPEDPAMIQAKANAASLEKEAVRKDAELKAKIAQDREEAEMKAATEITKLLSADTTERETVAKIAKIRAEITALNRGDKNQAGPAEDSASDEFAAAEGQPTAEPGSHYGPPKGLSAPVDNKNPKPKPNGQAKGT